MVVSFLLISNICINIHEYVNEMLTDHQVSILCNGINLVPNCLEILASEI